MKKGKNISHLEGEKKRAKLWPTFPVQQEGNYDYQLDRKWFDVLNWLYQYRLLPHLIRKGLFSRVFRTNETIEKENWNVSPRSRELFERPSFFNWSSWCIVRETSFGITMHDCRCWILIDRSIYFLPITI